MASTRRIRRTKGSRAGRPPGPASESTTRRDVLDAAREVFLQTGYEGATLQQVADRCGLNRSVLYHYFPSRRELYMELVTESEAVFQRIMALAAAQPTLVEQMSAFVRAAQKEDFRDRRVFAFIIQSFVEGGRQRGEHTRAEPGDAIRAFFVRLVSEAVGRRELEPSTDVRATAAMLIVLMFGMGVHAGFISGASRMQPIGEQLIRVIASGLPLRGAG